MTRVAFLWHMHQPYYEDLVTREHILPWVRMHALKDYYGMVALLEEFPDIRATFNLVPSLLVQLEAFAEGRAHDRYLELGLKPADALTPEETVFILRNFFHAQRARMIDVYPRYAELLARRGPVSSASDVDAAVRRFSEEDLRDLQVWQKLAWLDPYYLENDERARGLVAKGRQFSEADKATLRTIELELLRAVIPAYRRRADAGQIEIATSPFYHPILPLLSDTDVYKHTHPHSRMPRHRFRRPEDVVEQLERASACHERLFGRRPTGLWPSEGSVSDTIIPLVARSGFQWMATDELILARSLGTTFTRDSAGHVNQPDRLYSVYTVSAAGAQVACGFRDHALSDRIGFVYSGWNPEDAAADFVGRLAEGGRRAQDSGEEPTIFVILDGENAWEHFEGGGRPFLRALYRRLSGRADLRTVTMAEACGTPARSLHGIFPGSWIDANFYIWIGHPDDQRAWSQLAEARDALDAPTSVDAATVARAREEILIAEGSDWCWWYGDDHSSDHDLEFDDLFRRHLRNVYRLLGRPVPDELFVSNITAGAPASLQVDPIALLAPRIDGEETSYFEWLGAGSVEVRDTAGAMHQAERRPLLLSHVRFGFDSERLFIRLDGRHPLTDLLKEGHAFSLVFLAPEGVRFTIRATEDGLLSSLNVRTGFGAAWTERRQSAVVAAGTVLEISLPFADLTDTPIAGISFFVAVYDFGGVELERHPTTRPLEITIPDDSFAAQNWTA